MLCPRFTLCSSWDRYLCLSVPVRRIRRAVPSRTPAALLPMPVNASLVLFIASILTKWLTDSHFSAIFDRVPSNFSAPRRVLLFVYFLYFI